MAILWIPGILGLTAFKDGTVMFYTNLFTLSELSYVPDLRREVDMVVNMAERPMGRYVLSWIRSELQSNRFNRMVDIFSCRVRLFPRSC